MKYQNSGSPAAVLMAFLLRAASLAHAGEVSYEEAFDTTPVRWASTTEHAQLADWPNGDLSVARDKGVLRAWGTFPAHKRASSP